MPDAPASLGRTDHARETGTFAVDPGAVAEVDAWIGAVGQRWGASEKTIFAARLCVAELFANVLEHGDAKSARDQVTVALMRRADGLGIVFSDTGAPFDPTTVAAPVPARSIEAAAVEGRGLMLVRAYAKDLAYHRDAAGNHLAFRVEAR